MNVIYHKIWSDLWRHKARTLQVVLIIAMGAFAISMIVGARSLTAQHNNASWRISNLL